MGLGKPAFFLSRVEPFYPGSVVIEWAVQPRTIELFLPTFRVYRSGDPVDGFELIGETNSFFFEDKTPTMLDMDRDLYYYVEVTHKGKPLRTDTRDVNGESLSKKLCLMHRKVSRDWFLVMKKFNGVPILVYKRRRWGERCDACFEPITQETTFENCTECYGTGWKEGYYKPLKTYAKFEPPQDANNETDVAGLVQTTNQTITILSFPTVEKDDLLFDMKERKFHEISDKSETQMKRDAIHQTMPTSDLPRDNIQYCLDTLNYNTFDFKDYFGIPPRASK